MARVDALPRAEGDEDAFWVARENPPSHVQVSAVLRKVSRHAYWYVQDGLTVSDDALQTSADAFDDRIYPEVRRHLGSEPFPGIDNDPRVTIFNGPIPGLAGYVSSTDSYPASVRPFSNERDVVYLNPLADPIGSDEYLATLTHEFTHLVHWGVNPEEETWAKEGLGFLTPSIVFPSRRIASDAFAANPGLMLTSWTGDGHDTATATAHYQAAAWFLRYLADRLGLDALTCLLENDDRGLTRDPPFRACGYPSTQLADLYQDWAVASLTGTRTGPGVRPYGEQAPDPPRTQPLDAGSAVDGTVAQFGTVYYELPRGRPLDLELSGNSTVPVVPADSGGAPIWYSGRADNALSTLSRSFDLPTGQAASLDYDVWYDTEADYDYLYVAVSVDAGKSWTLLDAPSMSAPNPAGNNLGDGYTGRSGAGSAADWVHESIDLTPYAGQRVSVAFWYLTDDAVSGEGAALRDLRVEAAGYRGDQTAGDDGWAAAGWSRIGSLVPQVWSAQLVEITGDSARATRIQVDPSGQATWSAQGDADRSVVAVSGLTPITLERATFHLEARAR